MVAERSITRVIAAWLLAVRSSGLADAELDAAAGYLLDWLGSASAGRGTDPGRMLLAYARSQPEGDASVFGETWRRSAEVAALVNGGLSHIVEMDDVERRSVLHPGAVVIPAALALAETRARSGRALLAAVVAGYEVAIRVGEAVGRAHYRFFHNTSTCGVFGAAAAAAMLLDLDEDGIVWALGNAGTQASGLWEFNAEGAMSKHLHTGRAAANGVLAALLAEQGLTGPGTILEGERGFFKATAPDASPERVVEGLGSAPLKIHAVSIKPHPSCRHTHAAIDCALALQSRVRDSPIESVEVDTYGAALALCDRPEPRTPYDAKFSLQYVTASALARGHVGLSDFSEGALRDRDVRRLVAKTTTRLDPAIEARYPREWPSRVRVRLENGTELAHESGYPRGDPESPLTRSELEAKFRELLHGGDQEADADRLLTWVSSLKDGEPRLPSPSARAHEAQRYRSP
jgi:2-methylcitrate dehydratase PrpD